MTYFEPANPHCGSSRACCLNPVLPILLYPNWIFANLLPLKNHVMRVKSVELVNIKSHKRLKLQLSEGITLLIGANNSGKSTIIRSLLNLQYYSVTDKDIRAGEAYGRIFTELDKIGGQEIMRFYNPKQPKDLEHDKSFRIFWGVYRHGKKSEDYLYTAGRHKVKRIDGDKVDVTDVKGSKVELKTFERFTDRENENNFIYPFLSKRKTEYADQTVNQEQTYRVQETLRNLAAKIQKIGNSSHPKFEEFIRCCDDILGFRIGVVPMDQQGANGIEPGIYVTDSFIIPLKSMGEGVANIVGFIVTLLTDDKKLFLIEELENDIHPAALKKLLELMLRKSANNQFVISTHSHIVLKFLGREKNTKIFYLEWVPYDIRNGIKSNIPTSIVTLIENKPAARIDLLKKLGYDFHDFELFEAYLFLEESSAETIIRGFLIPMFVPSLVTKLKTIAAQGVNDLETRAHDFARLFVYVHTSSIYNNKGWVIADGDPSGKEIIARLRNSFTTWPGEHFINFSKSNFEEYYPKRFDAKVKAVFGLSDKKRQNAKIKLLEEVMNWALTNKQAISEFEQSAKEVIEILQAIDKELK